LGAEARAQYAALGRLRWAMLRNSLRSNKGVFELGARTLSYIFYLVGGLFLGGMAGLGAYALVSDEKWSYLPILFWVVLLIWQIVPIMLASFQEQFDLTVLLRFPVRFGSFFLLYVVFGLADISTVLGGLFCLGILVGTTLARPDLMGWTALALAVFAAFNILLVRSIFAWIDRWLQQRKTREILGMVFMLAMLSLNFLNPAFRHQGFGKGPHSASEFRKMKAEYGPLLTKINAVQEWLPPGLAALAVRRAGEQDPQTGLEQLGGLGFWVLAAGGALALRLKSEYRGESLGEAPAVKKAPVARQKAARKAAVEKNGAVGSGPIAAVIEKEIRSLMRTLPLLYAIGAPLLLVLMFSGIFNKGGGAPGHGFPLALPICMVYAQLGFTQMFYNNLGAEGAGIQLYFLSPTPIRTVMLAKNLFHSVLFVLVAFFAWVLAILRLGMPDVAVMAATGAWLLFSLPGNLAAGNIFSLKMPYRLNPGRISRQRGSQANGLLSLLVQLGMIGVGAVVFALCWLFDEHWLAVPIFLLFSSVAVYVWVRVMRNVDSMANGVRDSLIGTLMKAE
jgi:ABC-2 type transport system permease protein